MESDSCHARAVDVCSGLLRKCGILMLMGFVAGCSSPAQRLDQQAVALGFHRLVVKGSGFNHVVYHKEGLARSDTSLHVYLEGDGTPWVLKRVPAADPTPRNPLMLELMALDPQTSVYLGRPCYHGQQDAACVPVIWTDGRYSEAVVKSMSAALEKTARDYSMLVLFGHSGGGTLAMLLAERQPKVAAVVTVAANLDTEQWAKLHGQRELKGSLNPAKRPPLQPGIRQIHFAGAEDDNVPPQLVRDVMAHQQGAKFKVFQKQGHSCCWQGVWPEVLGTLAMD